MSHILYSFRRCPYAMRARMALSISGAEYEHREILLSDKPAAMLAVSPKGTVPVLLLDDGTVIDESYDVMVWALSQNDPENWLSSKDEAEQVLSVITGDFKYHLDRYKYANRYDESLPRGAVNLEHRDKAVAALGPLEERLSKTRFLCGDRRSFADIASFPFLRQFAATDADWWQAQPLPHVRAWLSELMDSALFQAIMQKYPLWSPQS